MNAACWREVALRGGLSVSDVMALRTVCRRFTFVFAATNNNPLWFSLFRNSCALYPALHNESLDPKDVLAHAYHELPVVDVFSDWHYDLDGELVPHAMQCQVALLEERCDLDEDCFKYIDGDPDDIDGNWDDPEDYVENWAYDAKIDWFREAAHDATLHTCRAMMATVLSVSSEHWIEGDGWCWCQLNGELDYGILTVVQPRKFNFSKALVALPDAPLSGSDASLSGSDEEEQQRRPNEDEEQQQRADEAAEFMVAAVQQRYAHDTRVDATVDDVLDAVDEGGLVWLFALALAANSLGHGAPHLTCADYLAARTLRREDATASLLSPALLRDMVQQVRFAAAFAPHRIVSIMRNLYCVLCKFGPRETQQLAERTRARWPVITRQARSCLFLTSHLTLPDTLPRHWTADIRCDLYEDDEQDGAVDEDVLTHNALHKLMARGGVVRAYPETCVAAQRSLRDFVRHVLSLVCETKSAGDDVDGMDVQRALARVAVRPAEFRPAYVYPFDGEGADSDGDECAFAFAADHVEGDDDAGVMGEGARCWFVSPTCGAMLTRTSGDAEFVAPDAPDDAMEDDVLRAQMVAAAEGDRNHSVLNPHGITRWTHRTLDPFDDARSTHLLAVNDNPPRVSVYRERRMPSSDDEDGEHIDTSDEHDEELNGDSDGPYNGGQSYRRLWCENVDRRYFGKVARPSLMHDGAAMPLSLDKQPADESSDSDEEGLPAAKRARTRQRSNAALRDTLLDELEGDVDAMIERFEGGNDAPVDGLFIDMFDAEAMFDAASLEGLALRAVRLHTDREDVALETALAAMPVAYAVLQCPAAMAARLVCAWAPTLRSLHAFAAPAVMANVVQCTALVQLVLCGDEVDATILTGLPNLRLLRLCRVRVAFDLVFALRNLVALQLLGCTNVTGEPFCRAYRHPMPALRALCFESIEQPDGEPWDDALCDVLQQPAPLQMLQLVARWKLPEHSRVYDVLRHTCNIQVVLMPALAEQRLEDMSHSSTVLMVNRQLFGNDVSTRSMLSLWSLQAAVLAADAPAPLPDTAFFLEFLSSAFH